MSERHTIYHTETGVNCGSFPSKEAAQQWLDNYGVTQEYKDRCYRIISTEEWNRRHARVCVPREPGVYKLRCGIPANITGQNIRGKWKGNIPNHMTSTWWTPTGQHNTFPDYDIIGAAV